MLRQVRNVRKKTEGGIHSQVLAPHLCKKSEWNLKNKSLELIIDFSKISIYMRNIQKLIVFPHTRSKETNRNFFKMPFMA